jgi:hypothetical protein
VIKPRYWIRNIGYLGFTGLFFSIPPDSKTYYEFILGWSAVTARRMPVFKNILYHFAMLTLNSYEKVSSGYEQYIIKVSADQQQQKHSKTRTAKSSRGCF